jgi:hypothetical protein
LRGIEATERGKERIGAENAGREGGAVLKARRLREFKRVGGEKREKRERFATLLSTIS